jgi:LPXTG-motif cell wall-anchored protein
MLERVAKAVFRGDNDGDEDSILTGLSGIVIVVLVVLGILYFARRRG